MTTIETQVVVIGGGATGTGILRDLALRGINAVLVEQADLAHGTSSRFHGLLHSGARYAVKDNEAARECLQENMILRRIAPNCVEVTGGLFVQLQDDDPEYTIKWLEGCAKAGIETSEIAVDEVLKQNPSLNKDMVRAFSVPDCNVDGFRVVWGNVNSARHHGAKVMTYCKVNALQQVNGRVSGVEVTHQLTGEKILIACELVINAAGAWAGEIARLAQFELPVIKDKGTLLAFNHRVFNRVINRLRAPGDGDIFVPHGTITILGTTSGIVDDPGCTKPGYSEVTELLKIGSELLPDIANCRLIRAFAGVRPLYQGSSAGSHDGRTVTRNFALIDHSQTDNLQGMISIVGGKFTTYRLMAEKTVDLAAQILKVSIPCRTAIEPLTTAVSEELLNRGRKVFGFVAAKKAAERLGDNFTDVVTAAEKDPDQRQMYCECELVTMAELKSVAASGDCHTLGDLRRKTRLGMGTCQGTFCGYRSLGVLNAHTKFADDHKAYLGSFLQRRWQGIRPVLWGEQLREAQLSTGIYSALFTMERMK